MVTTSVMTKVKLSSCPMTSKFNKISTSKLETTLTNSGNSFFFTFSIRILTTFHFHHSDFVRKKLALFIKRNIIKIVFSHENKTVGSGILQKLVKWPIGIQISVQMSLPGETRLEVRTAYTACFQHPNGH